MTATDELRALLDERGVEWEDGGEGSTIIPAQDGVPKAWTVNTWPSGKDMGDCLWVQNRHPLTPSQAIAATLGRGTCHDIGDPCDFCCSECGVRMFTESNDTYTMIAADERNIIKHPNFCPNCGREVVD